MKKVLIAAFLFAAQFSQAQDADIKKSIQTFFDGLHTADTLKIQSVASKKMVLQSIYDGTTKKLEDETLGEFYKSIASIPKNFKIEERLLSYNIQQDGNMAHVWTPYEFYLNEKISHSGTNSFTLYKDNGVWKIVHIIDTRRPAKK